MTLSAFMASISSRQQPEGLKPPLSALWHDGVGDWDEAHRVAQDIDDRMGAKIHAYLHRKEGDIGNAGYWYQRTAVPPFKGTLDQEWQMLVTEAGASFFDR